MRKIGAVYRIMPVDGSGAYARVRSRREDSGGSAAKATGQFYDIMANEYRKLAENTPAADVPIRSGTYDSHAQEVFQMMRSKYNAFR